MSEIKKKFCPKCGREADKLLDGMCIECFFAKKRTVEIPAGIVVKRCKRCGRYFAAKAMGRIEDVIDEELKRIFAAGAKHAKTGIRALNYRIADGKAYASLKFDFDGVQKSEEHAIEIKQKPITCQYCALIGLHYYNAVLQIRAPEHVIDKAFDEAVKKISEMKSDRLAFITEVKQMKNGVDVYIGSKPVATKAAKAIKEKFGRKSGEFNVKIKTTRKLVGRKLGRDVYRDTILILIEQNLNYN